LADIIELVIKAILYAFIVSKLVFGSVSKAKLQATKLRLFGVNKATSQLFHYREIE